MLYLALSREHVSWCCGQLVRTEGEEGEPNGNKTREQHDAGRGREVCSKTPAISRPCYCLFVLTARSRSWLPGAASLSFHHLSAVVRDKLAMSLMFAMNMRLKLRQTTAVALSYRRLDACLCNTTCLGADHYRPVPDADPKSRVGCLLHVPCEHPRSWENGPCISALTVPSALGGKTASRRDDQAVMTIPPRS